MLRGFVFFLCGGGLGQSMSGLFHWVSRVACICCWLQCPFHVHIVRSVVVGFLNSHSSL